MHEDRAVTPQASAAQDFESRLERLLVPQSTPAVPATQESEAGELLEARSSGTGLGDPAQPHLQGKNQKD